MIRFRQPYKFFLSFLAIVCFGTAARSQSFTITVNNASHTYNSSATVEAGATNTSAFALEINSGSKDYNLTAAITAKSFNPATTSFSATPFNISLRSITGVTTTGQVTGPIEIPDAPLFASLATNATRTLNRNTAVWTYDLHFKPIGYTIPPGTYSFTMTVRYNDLINIIDRSFNITLTVQPTLNLELIQNNVATYNFNTVSTLIDGIELKDANTFKIKSNVSWLCNVAAATDHFTFNGTNNNDMPAEIMGIRRSWVRGMLALRRTSSTLKTGAPGDPSVSGNTFNIDLLSNPTFDYPPGQYVINVIYTLTQQ